MQGPGTGRIVAGSPSYYYAPCATFGNIFSNNAGGTAEILNYGGGSFVTGSAFSGGTATCRIKMGGYSYGSFLGGYAFASASPATAFLYNYAQGCFVWGYVGANNNASNLIGSVSGATGAMVVGYCGQGGAGVQNRILGSGPGSLTAGFVQGLGGHTLQASGQGAFAVGRLAGNLPYGQVIASGQGAFAQGRTQNEASILSGGRGSFAQGNAQNLGSYLSAPANGAMAQGHATNGGYILASGTGSLAHGAAVGAGIYIVATATNSSQIGPGYNAVADTFQVGNSGLRLKGTAGATAPVQNGDIWVAGGIVYIQSGGVACACTNAVM
jgi:hypothetical protein